MTSNKINIGTVALPTLSRYQDNLDKALEYIYLNSKLDLLVVPEVFFSGFDYDHMMTAAKFSVKVIKELKRVSVDKIIVATLIMEERDGFVNRAVVFYGNKIVHKQNKSKLFKLGGEHKEFIAGSSKKVKPFEVSGVRYAILICFELRFKELWKNVEGADIVLIPAQWGKARRVHLEVLSKGLAVMNQCFVVVANSASDDMAPYSVIISPNGEETTTVDLKEIKKIKRYIDMKD